MPRRARTFVIVLAPFALALSACRPPPPPIPGLPHLPGIPGPPAPPSIPIPQPPAPPSPWPRPVKPGAESRHEGDAAPAGGRASPKASATRFESHAQKKMPITSDT